MKRKWLIAFICFASMLLLSGCWSEEEPKNLAILDSILYDVKDDGKYRVVAEFLNPTAAGGTKDGASGGSPNMTVESESDNIRIAFAQISASVERRTYASHNKVRFFTEEFASMGMTGTLDYIFRDHLTLETPLMIIVRADEPEKIYSAKLGLSDTVGNYIESLSRYQHKSLSQSVFTTTLDFVKDYYKEGKEPVMGLVALLEDEQETAGEEEGKGEEKKMKIEYEGLAAFKGDKLVGYMDGQEARSYNLITNNLNSALISVSNDYGASVLEIEKSKAQIMPVMKEDGIAFDVNLHIMARLVAEEGIIDVTTEDALTSIEESFNREMVSQIGECILKAQQEFGSDIFGFGSYVHIKYHQKWKEIKENWNDDFSKAQINITVESLIDRIGEIKEPIEMGDGQ